MTPVTLLMLGQPSVCYQDDGDCLLYEDGLGGVETLLKIDDTGIYVSLTGTAATATATDVGWILREPDGRRLYFNADGYLKEDRDRFGNGFDIVQEKTPLYKLYRTYCVGGDTAPAFPNEDSRVCATLANLFGDADGRSWPTWSVPNGADNRVVNGVCDGYEWRYTLADSIGCTELGALYELYSVVGFDDLQWAPPFPVTSFLHQCFKRQDSPDWTPLYYDEEKWRHPLLTYVIAFPVLYQ